MAREPKNPVDTSEAEVSPDLVNVQINASDLRALGAKAAQKLARSKMVDVVNITLRPLTLYLPAANGLGTKRVILGPLKKATIPEALFKQLANIGRRNGRNVNPITYVPPVVALAPEAGTDKEFFVDKASGQRFQTCKFAGTVADGTAQAGVDISVAQAQALAGRLPDSKHIRALLEVDFRPLVQAYAGAVMMRREREEQAMVKGVPPNPRSLIQNRGN